jgi:hypothetical protein
VAGVVAVGAFGPFHFDRNDAAVEFDDVVDLGTVLGAEVVEPARARERRARPRAPG